MSEEGVQVTNEAGVGVISFSHPKANSLSSLQLQELTKCVQQCGADPAVKVILLKSSGQKAFCAGASFDELLTLKTQEEATEYFLGFARVILAMRNVPKCIVVRVQGKAVGGALGLIAAADYSIAQESASVRLSELALGFGPFVISQPLIRKLGVSAFEELALSAEWHEASWALQRGLYSRVVSSKGDALDAAVGELTTQLASRSAEAMQRIKEIAWQGTDDWETLLHSRAQYAARLALSPETRENLKKFQGKS